MRHFEPEWNSYRDEVLPAGAGETQVSECRRAFYAGAWAFHQLTLRLIAPEPDPEKSLHLMEVMVRELQEFADAVAERRA